MASRLIGGGEAVADDLLRSMQDRVRELDGEVQRLQVQLTQRENALTELNRRLLEFDRAQGGLDGFARAQLTYPNVSGDTQDDGALPDTPDDAQLHVLSERNHVLEEELAAMRSTRVFRWSRPARRIYARFRGLP